ncbi:MAG: thioredoxin domain-containing protein [Phycisphaerales bacterium]
MNRLANEPSPYLLQHAGNPVDWFPWGDEAIATARALDKPLFVSIGYSTCYWCHVMERESFEDHATAAVLNRLFVPVKVDREQRPDVDDVYMTACQVFTQLTEGRASGGWPLSVFVEPRALRPFYVGTYFPNERKYGRASFVEVLEAIGAAWRDDRARVESQAEELAEIVRGHMDEALPPVALGESTVMSAIAALLRIHDQRNGGFGGAPKFPQPAYLELLERRADVPEVAAALRRTLDGMALGGIFDQLAGGFHRYSVDSQWVVPHFEKMLYDNAQLAPLYARSLLREGDAFHAEVARRTCEYVLREMTEPDGAFRSAQDAEVDAREGQSYVWRDEEVRDALEDRGAGELADFALRAFGVDLGPNFHDPHHPDALASNVLRLVDRPERLAAALGLDLATFQTRLDRVRAALLAARSGRRQPGIDDKVIAAWNGLMIAALAECGQALGEPRFVDAAVRAAEAVERRLRDPRGELLRASRGDRASVPAFLEDYACLCKGRIALHRATGRNDDLRAAASLFDDATARFAAPRGGYYDVRDSGRELFVRARTLSDGAMPSGGSIMLANGLDLAALTGDVRWRDEFARALRGVSATLDRQPLAMALAVACLDRGLREGATAEPLDADAPLDGMVASIEPAELVAEQGDDGVVRGSLVVELPAPWRVHLGAGADASVASAPAPLRVEVIVPAAGATIEVELPSGAMTAGGRIAIPFRVRGADRTLVLEALVQPCDDLRCARPRRLRATATIRQP